MIDHGAPDTGPIVVKIGGSILTDAPKRQRLAARIAELQGMNESGFGRGVVVVHGGGSIATARLAEAGIAEVRIDGLRVTPPEAVPLLLESFKGLSNGLLLHALQQAGIKAIGLCATDGGSISSGPLDLDQLGHVGSAAPGSPDLIESLLAQRVVPVCCSLGHDSELGWLNINADDVASAIAQTVHARSLVLLSDVEAVLDADGRPIPSLTREQAESLIEAGTIAGGMIPKVRAALAAAEAAACPAIIASADADVPLNSLLGGSGVGTTLIPTLLPEGQPS